VSGATPQEWFWDRVARGDGCWEWTLCRDRHGYGRVTIPGKRTHLAHRVAWMLTNGPPPPGLFVLHNCDNPPCVNPDHLRLGTQADNMHDMALRRRSGHLTKPHRILRGEGVGTSKLTQDSVDAIRVRYAAGGISLSRLGSEYSVTKHCIWHVVRGRRWR
jgi:hypothetical protein